MICRAFCLFLLYWSIGCALSSSPQTSQGFGAVAVMQGATSDTEAQFVVAVPRQEKVQVELLSEKPSKVLLKTLGSAIEFKHSQWKLIQFRFSQLIPGASYGLRLKGEVGNWVDERRFSTFPRNPKSLRLAVVSCARDDLKGINEIWKALSNDKPQLVLMIGDNTYADIGVQGVVSSMTAARLWDRHMETRNKLAFFRGQDLRPVFATWDDHDYGQNNGGRDFKLKKESAKVFSAFFPMLLKTNNFSSGPGVAKQLTVGEQNFVLFDNRSFRAPAEAQQNKVHFGAQQIQWATSRMKKTHLNWLVSGDQFFGGYHPFESFEGQHKKAFQNFLQKIKSLQVPTVFISGDRHMSEVMKISKGQVGQDTFEITSSPIHSTVYQDAARKHKNPRRLSAVSGQWNYVLMEIDRDVDANVYHLKTQAKGVQGQTFFSNTLKVAR